MNDTDLLDLLAAEDTPDVVHMVMPCMSLACGADHLTMLRAASATGRHLTTLTSAGTTCPDCLARYGGLDGMRAEMRRQMGHQAEVAP